MFDSVIKAMAVLILLFASTMALMAENFNAPAPLAVDTKTKKHAPDGTPDSRKTVGVCEVVEIFTVPSIVATWEVSDGSGYRAASFDWTAPDVGSTVTFTAYADDGRTASVTLTVIPPSGIHFKNPRPQPTIFLLDLDTNLIPGTVCFGNIFVQEVPGPASSPSGDFVGLPAAIYTTVPPGGIAHDPSPGFDDVLDSNDTASGDILKSIYPGVNPSTGATPVFGGFTWAVPNVYSASASGSNPHLFTTVNQVFTWTRDPNIPDGRASLQKGDSPTLNVP